MQTKANFLYLAITIVHNNYGPNFVYKFKCKITLYQLVDTTKLALLSHNKNQLINKHW